MAGVPDCAGCAELRKEIEVLRQELRELRGRLNLSSRNSSKPPSSDPPGALPRPPARPTGRKPGGQPGHPGATRAEFRVEEIDHRTHVPADRCEGCRASLTDARVDEPERCQVVELPAVVAEVTEHMLERRICRRCGHTTTAPRPDAALGGAIGPRFQAVLAVLVGRFRLSRREAQEAALALFGPKARVSLGWIAALEGRLTATLDTSYAQVEAHVRASALVHADETSFRQGKLKTWLWTAATALAAFFRIDCERSRKAFERLLGKRFAGTLVTDRWASYHRHARRRRQLCWAHLKRNAQELEDRGKPGAQVGTGVLAVVADVFDAYDEHRRQGTSLATLSKRISPVRLRLFALLNRGRTNADRKAAAFCKDLLKLFPCLWTFARIPGTPLTNNLAERRLRPAVLWRKSSFGCHSESGSRFAERMLTVVQTLRAQGRPVLDFLEQAIRAALGLARAPRILPA